MFVLFLFSKGWACWLPPPLVVQHFNKDYCRTERALNAPYAYVSVMLAAIIIVQAVVRVELKDLH